MNDVGESVRSLNKRHDDAVWPNILTGLKKGGQLKLHYKINKAVLEGLPDNDPCMSRGRTITIARARRLEREGVIVQTGIDQYMLTEEGRQ
jgi:hypothetical protein